MIGWYVVYSSNTLHYEESLQDTLIPVAVGMIPSNRTILEVLRNDELAILAQDFAVLI